MASSSSSKRYCLNFQQLGRSDKTVIVTDVVSCYHGWNVDFSTCKEVHVQVYAFFVPSDPHQAVKYALTKYQIREAVSRFGNDQVVQKERKSLQFIIFTRHSFLNRLTVLIRFISKHFSLYESGHISFVSF